MAGIHPGIKGVNRHAEALTAGALLRTLRMRSVTNCGRAEPCRPTARPFWAAAAPAADVLATALPARDCGVLAAPGDAWSGIICDEGGDAVTEPVAALDVPACSPLRMSKNACGACMRPRSILPGMHAHHTGQSRLVPALARARSSRLSCLFWRSASRPSCPPHFCIASASTCMHASCNDENVAAAWHAAATIERVKPH